jgi:hypothetical protein
LRYSHRAPGSARSATVALALLLASGGCYGFAGGGLPPQIRTVAILPFDNQTAEPLLTQEVADALREAMQNRLGLRPASEANADAVVRGAILRYESDIPLSFQPSQRAGGQVEVTARRVQLTLRVEIIDQREGRPLWQRQSMMVDGEYQPGQEGQGRQTALAKLVTDIVDGAQSQW